MNDAKAIGMSLEPIGTNSDSDDDTAAMQVSNKVFFRPISFLFMGLFSLWPVGTAPFVPSLTLFVILWILAVIDWHTYRLPNIWVLIMVLAGLTVNYRIGVWPFHHYIVGVLSGAAVLLLVNIVYRTLRGRDGLGMGDIKFIAGAGAWAGWQGLPAILFIASLSALLFAAIKSFPNRKLDMQSRLPFGPFLCLGTWLVWLFIV